MVNKLVPMTAGDKSTTTWLVCLNIFYIKKPQSVICAETNSFRQTVIPVTLIVKNAKNDAGPRAEIV